MAGTRMIKNVTANAATTMENMKHVNYGPVEIDIPNIFERYILRKKDNVKVLGCSLGTLKHVNNVCKNAGMYAVIAMTSCGATIGAYALKNKITRKKCKINTEEV